MNEPQISHSLPVLDVPELRRVDNDPMADILHNSRVLETFTEEIDGQVQTYEIRRASASHPHTLSSAQEIAEEYTRHEVLWVTKVAEVDEAGKPTWITGVSWQEFVTLDRVQKGMLGQFSLLSQTMHEKYGPHVVGGFHIGFADNQKLLELGEDIKKQFQKKPGLQTVEAVHFYAVAAPAGYPEKPVTRQVDPAAEGLLANKFFDLAGIGGYEIFRPEIEQAIFGAGGVEDRLPNRPERLIFRFKNIETAMQTAFRLQQQLSEYWIERITSNDQGLQKLFSENNYLFALIEMWHLNISDLKQFVVPSMLVMVGEQNEVWLVPLSAGNAAVEMLWYALLRQGYDEHYYKNGKMNGLPVTG